MAAACKGCLPRLRKAWNAGGNFLTGSSDAGTRTNTHTFKSSIRLDFPIASRLARQRSPIALSRQPRAHLPAHIYLGVSM